MVHRGGSIVFVAGIRLRRSRLRIAGGLSVARGTWGSIRGARLTEPSGGSGRSRGEIRALLVQLPLGMESCTEGGGGNLSCAC